jgi:hypothetical protein
MPKFEEIENKKSRRSNTILEWLFMSQVAQFAYQKKYLPRLCNSCGQVGIGVEKVVRV